MVWIVGRDDKLRGRDGETGATLFVQETDVVPGVERFQAPIIAKGRIFVAASDRVYAFTTR